MNIAYFLTPKQDTAFLYDEYTVRQALEKMRARRHSPQLQIRAASGGDGGHRRPVSGAIQARYTEKSAVPAAGSQGPIYLLSGKLGSQ